MSIAIPSQQQQDEKQERFLEIRLFRDVCEGKKRKETVYSDLSIPKERFLRLFSALRTRLGKIESCKEYTRYVHWNMELTVLPDGSSFCHQVKTTPEQCKDLPRGTRCFNVSRTKIANDYFPPRYKYNAVMDTVDVVFPWSDAIEIILRLRLEESDATTAPAVSILKLADVQGAKSAWVEVIVKTSEKTDEIYDILPFLIENLQSKVIQ